MAFERNDIVNKTRLMGELGEELMGYEHNDIVTVDKMNEAIAEGGGGDLTTAQVTLVDNTANGITVYVPYIDEDVDYHTLATVYPCGSDTSTITCVLYKGEAELDLPSDIAEPITITVTGDAEVGGGGTYVAIYGDCTITFDDN